MAGPGRGMGPRGFLTEEEKQNMPQVSKDLILRILSYLKPYWFQFLLVFAAILLSAVLGLLPSIITGRIVDEALVGRNMRLLIQLLLMAFVTLAASQVISVLESYINAWISQRIIFDMKNQMYDHLQRMPHAFFTSEKQGDIITRMNTDISGVSSVISGTLSSIVSNIATVVTTLVALFTMSWKLAIVGIVVIPLLILPTKSVGKTRWKILNESQAKSDELNQLINETLSVSGSLLVKLFTREQREYERFVSVNEEVTQLQLKEQRSGKWFRVIMGMFTQIGPLLIYFAGGYLIISETDSSLTVGVITATVALVNRLYRPIESLLNIHVDFTRSLSLFSRIFEYFDMENPIVSPENGQKPDVTNGDKIFLMQGSEADDAMSLATARRKGIIGDNIVADPQFVDPLAFDFTLKETSPALQNGFESWDYSAAGTLPGTVIGLTTEGGQTAYNDHAAAQTPGGSRVKLAFFKELLNRLAAALQKLLRMLGIKETVC